MTAEDAWRSVCGRGSLANRPNFSEELGFAIFGAGFYLCNVHKNIPELLCKIILEKFKKSVDIFFFIMYNKYIR